MRGEAHKQLDRIEQLEPGRGMLEAYMLGRGGLRSGFVGGALDYSHRLDKSLSAFAQAEAGYRYGNSPGLEYKAMAGLRWVW